MRRLPYIDECILAFDSRFPKEAFTVLHMYFQTVLNFSRSAGQISLLAQKTNRASIPFHHRLPPLLLITSIPHSAVKDLHLPPNTQHASLYRALSLNIHLSLAPHVSF